MKLALLLIIWLILSVTALATVLAHEPEECECACEQKFETISEPAVFEDVKRGAPETGVPADDDFLKRIQSRLRKIDRIPEPEGKT